MLFDYSRSRSLNGRHEVDVALLAIYRKKGIGKSTLAASFGIQYSMTNGRAPIYSNMKLTVPGIETFQVSKIAELIAECHNDPCTCVPRVIVADEFDKSFTSRIGWVNKDHEQKLTKLVSDIRKHRCIAFIATSQLKKKIKNDFRLNCDYVIEPTGTLDAAKCPEYFLWSDVELYEESRRSRYADALLCSSIFPLDFLAKTFNTRQTIDIEWE